MYQLDHHVLASGINARWPEYRGETLRWLHEGEHFVLAVLGETRVVRIPRSDADRWRLRREVALLGQLQGTVAWPLPRYDDVRQGWGRYRYLVGTPLPKASSLPAGLGQELQAFLGWLHHQPVAQPNLARRQWARRYRALVSRLEPQVMPLLTVRDRRQSQRRLMEGLDLLEHRAWEPTLIHGNLAPRHVLVAGENWALAGIVDFSQWRIGDAALDWSGIEGLEAFLPGRLADDECFRARLRFYQFLRPFEGILRALKHGRVEAAERHVQWVRRQLSQ
ncbi:MAG: phosphotransferase [Firmicutes bacterium]|nr:phosphotransferase [Bacillota bacterium]